MGSVGQGRRAAAAALPTAACLTACHAWAFLWRCCWARPTHLVARLRHALLARDFIACSQLQVPAMPLAWASVQLCKQAALLVGMRAAACARPARACTLLGSCGAQGRCAHPPFWTGQVCAPSEPLITRMLSSCCTWKCWGREPLCSGLNLQGRGSAVAAEAAAAANGYRHWDLTA